jgi:hypothetical protein
MIAARCFVALLFVATIAAPALAVEPHKTEVTARPFAQFGSSASETRFGELEFRGGLVLDSPDNDFGGWSGLQIDRDGSLLAVADTGFWLTASIVEKDGILTGVEGPALAPILDASGKVRPSKVLSDAEAVRLVGDGNRRTALVAFERGEISRFAFSPDVFSAVAEPVKLPASARKVTSNQGFETIAVPPPASVLSGATVLVAEHSLDKNGNHRGWIVGGRQPGTFSIRRIGNFDITDGDFLPNGDLVILERLFNASEGLGMRVRHIPAADIAPGKTADGPVLMTAGLNGHRIDNMEGLSLRPEADGSTSIFIISDDNHSMLQQTLLLKFSWPAQSTQ